VVLENEECLVRLITFQVVGGVFNTYRAGLQYIRTSISA